MITIRRHEKERKRLRNERKPKCRSKAYSTDSRAVHRSLKHVYLVVLDCVYPHGVHSGLSPRLPPSFGQGLVPQIGSYCALTSQALRKRRVRLVLNWNAHRITYNVSANMQGASGPASATIAIDPSEERNKNVGLVNILVERYKASTTVAIDSLTSLSAGPGQYGMDVDRDQVISMRGLEYIVDILVDKRRQVPAEIEEASASAYHIAA